MKKNFSEVSVYKKIKANRNRIKSGDKTLETTIINNNNSLNSSQINSKILLEKQKQDQEKPKKFTYLSHRVQIPIIYYERVKFIKELFNSEDLSFAITYAPSSKMATTKQLGKFFREKTTNILNIATTKKVSKVIHPKIY